MFKWMKMRGILPAVFFLVLLVVFYRYYEVIFPVNPKRPKVTVILKTIERSTSFWVTLEQGVLQASEDFEVDVTIKGSSREDDIDGQITILFDAAKENPDAIILAATDFERLVEPVLEVVKAGIPVLAVDSFVNTDEVSSNIGTANFEAGSKLATYLRTKLPPGASIGILSYVGESSTAIQRENGVRAGIEEEFFVLPTLYDNDDIELRDKNARRLLQNDKLDAIVTLNEFTSMGLLNAIGHINSPNEKLLFTFDSNLEIIQGIEDGFIEATIVQKPYSMGYQSIKTAVEMIKGSIPAQYIDTGSELVSRENLFDPVIQQLLFPTGR